MKLKSKTKKSKLSYRKMGWDPWNTSKKNSVGLGSPAHPSCYLLVAAFVSDSIHLPLLFPSEIRLQLIVVKPVGLGLTTGTPKRWALKAELQFFSASCYVMTDKSLNLTEY